MVFIFLAYFTLYNGLQFVLKELLKYKDISIFISSQISFLTVPHSKWDLSSLTRGQTHAPCSGSMES